MRPKYSSPGAELLNCMHCRCAHLLLVAPQGPLLLVAAAADADGCGVAASAGLDGAPAVKKMPLATISTSDSVGIARFTLAKLLRSPMIGRRWWPMGSVS